MANAIDGTFNGRCLSTLEKINVRNAIQKLKANEGLKNVTFWGRIFGEDKDYFIIQSTEFEQEILKSYYWSNDAALTFAQLPRPDEFTTEKTSLHRTLFTGDPSRKLPDPLAIDAAALADTEQALEIPDVKQEVKEKDVRLLTELERLSATVVHIDDDTCVVPKGAFYLTATGNIVQNFEFEGLSLAESNDFKNYHLFRRVRNPQTGARARQMKESNTTEFLDSLDEQLPKGVWVKRTDSTGLSLKLRNLEWPGYEFQIDVGASKGVAAYFGQGLINDHLHFML